VAGVHRHGCATHCIHFTYEKIIIIIKLPIIRDASRYIRLLIMPLPKKKRKKTEKRKTPTKPFTSHPN